MRLWLLHCLSIFALIPSSMHAAEVNAGFVRGFWYSDDVVFAEQTTRVYVAIRNNTQADLTGTVTFYDNDEKIGLQSVTALDSRIIESWTDWKPTYGEHTLRAELSRIKLSAIGSSTESVDSALAAATDTRFIDYDTDGDGVGNTADNDDDGDGALDSDEIKNNTNPLVFTQSIEPNEPAEEASRNDTPNITQTVRTATTSGIEQYLTPSRADTLLTSLTTWADDTKEQVDTYRETRARERAHTEIPESIVNSDGFGTITRTQTPTSETPLVQKQSTGIIDDTVRIVGSILSAIMTGLLAVLSWVLGHPMLIQLLLLLSILFGIYLAAQKFGSRPRTYKKSK